MEVTRCGFGQLFVVVGMDGGQGDGVQMLLLVAAGMEVSQSSGRKMLLLLVAGTENILAVTINK